MVTSSIFTFMFSSKLLPSYYALRVTINDKFIHLAPGDIRALHLQRLPL